MSQTSSEDIAAKMTLKKVNPIKDFIAGGVGGAFLVITGHPLDTIKVSLKQEYNSIINISSKLKGSVTNTNKTTTWTSTIVYWNIRLCEKNCCKRSKKLLK